NNDWVTCNTLRKQLNLAYRSLYVQYWITQTSVAPPVIRFPIRLRELERRTVPKYSEVRPPAPLASSILHRALHPSVRPRPWFPTSYLTAVCGISAVGVVGELLDVIRGVSPSSKTKQLRVIIQHLA